MDTYYSRALLLYLQHEWSITFIVVVQLNYAITPTLGRSFRP